MKTEFKDITQNVYSTTPLAVDSTEMSESEKAAQVDKLNQELLAVRAVLKKDFTLGRKELEAWFYRVVYISYGMYRTEQLLTKLGYTDDRMRDAYFAEKHRASGPFLKDHAYRRIALYFGYHNAGYPRTTGEWKKGVRSTIHEAIKFYQIESLREFIGFDFAMRPESGISNAVAANGVPNPRGGYLKPTPRTGAVPIEVEAEVEELPEKQGQGTPPEPAGQVLLVQPATKGKKPGAKEAIFAARMTEIARELKLLSGLKSLLIDTQKLAPLAEWNIRAEAKTAISTLKGIQEILEEAAQ